MSARPPAPPGYDVVGELGRGGMGVVRAGVERRSGRPVALFEAPRAEAPR